MRLVLLLSLLTILLMNELPRQHTILIVDDFSLGQILPNNVANMAPLIQNFNLPQHSKYSILIHGGILDLVFDSSNSDIASVIPSPYSDHFVLSVQIWRQDMIYICTVSSTHVALLIITLVTLSTCFILFYLKLSGTNGFLSVLLK